MKLSKKIIAIFLSAVFTVISLVSSVSAEVPYTSYTYSYTDTYLAPHAYVPSMVIDGEKLGIGRFAEPRGMFVQGNKIYLADTKNNRIVIINSDFKLDSVIDGFSNNGKDDSFNAPQDVFVSDNSDIYVADTENKRIVILNSSKKLKKIITKPETDLLADNVEFKPLKLVSNGMGNIYSVIQHVNSGVVEMDRDGNFKTFFGANKTKENKWEYIKKQFKSKEQREKMQQNVPTNYNNLYIDEDGFIFVTTDSYDEAELMKVLNSTTDQADSESQKTMAPVRRLNLTGTDVLKRNAATPPIGDLAFNIGSGSSLSGGAEIVDVNVTNDGTYSILDRAKCRVFTYDPEGNLLYMFGGKGSSVGNMLTPTALDALDEYFLVLDSSMNNITVYRPTDYGKTIRDASLFYYNGEYDRSIEKWSECLKYNATYLLAYEGLGKSSYRKGEYEQAMEYFKLANSKTGYSKAFKIDRQQNAMSYFGVAAGITMVLLIAYLVIRHLRKKGKIFKKKERN